MKIGILSALMVLSQATFAGHFVGNGGDHLRATYIRMGDAVIDFLKETDQGSAIVKKAQLNVGDLDASLDIAKISVTNNTLRDNSGSVVEAIGVPGSVTLNQEAWANHFESELDVYYLVFHEMLRSAGVNDDNYVVSASLNPFPALRRVQTRIAPVLPLIAEDLLAQVFDLKSVNVAGTGCPQSLGQTHIEFDQERNVLEIRPNQYRNDVSVNRPQDIKSCQVAIPVVLPKNKRLVISQIDLLGKIDVLAGAKAQISFEAFLAGTSAARKTRIFQPTSALVGRVLTRRIDVLKSNCGGSDIARLNTNMTTISSGKKLESLEMNSIRLYMSLEDCKAR